MHSFTHTLFAVASAAGFLTAQVLAVTPDPVAIQIVTQQFINAKIVPDAIPEFKPVGLLDLVFTAGGKATVGQAISKDNVGTVPAINPTGDLNGASTQYTVMMVDANYVGSANPDGLNLHWLQNNLNLTAGSLVASDPAVIPYAGPAPASGTGPHRYTVLVYAQPADFTAPAAPKPNSGVHLIKVADYISAAKFTSPLIGSYFTVEVGTATVNVGPTSAVNTDTLAPATSTGGGSATGKPRPSATGSGAGSTPSTPGGAAGKNGVAAGGLVLAALGVIVALV